ncbi:MAG: hypothetical protein HYY20_07185 [Candidatus Tectomicrobia bacterium]|uniref:Peptidylamidoglycolate lyase n=1 Tax=Tectimicrobiota bacterium TaxID=2528274 RepID=A0A932CNH6_UNCTE|nr:hypothetical protein [Candidatus Tectomicrobia bacterium]
MKRALYVYVGAIVMLFSLALGLWNPLSALGPTPQEDVGEGSEAPPPKFQVDPFWPKPLPHGWITGEVAGTCVDSRDHLFILNRRKLTEKELRRGTPAPAVIELSGDGSVLNAWTPPVLPDTLHGCYVDHEDNVWIAGNGDAIVQKYAHDGSTLLLQIGEKGNFDPTNQSKTLLNRPADVAVDPTNGDIYIADGYGNHRVVVFDRNGRYLRQWGEQATPQEAEQGVGGKLLGTVHCVVLGKDGLVYVCDRKGNRIQVFDKTGRFRRNLWIHQGVGSNVAASIGTAWDIAFSPDPSQTFLYDTDGEQEVLWIVGRQSGRILTGFGRPGHMAGEFTFLHTITVDSKGNLYAGETIDGRRVQRFNLIGRGP